MCRDYNRSKKVELDKVLIIISHTFSWVLFVGEGSNFGVLKV